MSNSSNFVMAYGPCRMTVLLYLIVTQLAVKATLQPALQSCPMDIKACIASCGTMCPWQATSGSPGKSRLALCVEWRTVPDGV